MPSLRLLRARLKNSELNIAVITFGVDDRNRLPE